MKEEGLIPETSTSTDDSLEPFKNGEAAMTVAASSNLAKVDGINWDYSILSGPENTKTFVASDSLVLFNKCKNKDLAIKLMKYVTSKDVMADFHERVSEQPPITADDTYSGDEKFAEFCSQIRQTSSSHCRYSKAQVPCMIPCIRICSL